MTTQKQIIDMVDGAFAGMYAYTRTPMPSVKVEFEGHEWIVTGSYHPAEPDVGIDCSEFQAESIMFALSPDGSNLIDRLTQAMISHLEELALIEYEANEKESKICGDEK